MVSLLKAHINPLLDPLQYSYRQRGTDDAINSIIHLIITHLEETKAHARLLFVDFSSAFNTLQPSIY